MTAWDWALVGIYIIGALVAAVGAWAWWDRWLEHQPDSGTAGAHASGTRSFRRDSWDAPPPSVTAPGGDVPYPVYEFLPSMRSGSYYQAPPTDPFADDEAKIHLAVAHLIYDELYAPPQPVGDTTVDERLPEHIRALLSGSESTGQIVDRLFAHINARHIVADAVAAGSAS